MELFYKIRLQLKQKAMDSTVVCATSSTEPTVAKQLDEENARASKLDAMIAALELLQTDKLGLGEASIKLFEQTREQLQFQKFVQLPCKQGSAPIQVLGT